MMKATKRNPRKGSSEPLRYLVFIRRTSTGYSADVPDLPGCVAAARSVTAARRLIRDSIALHLDLMSRSGERITAPRKRVEFQVGDTPEEEFCTWVVVRHPVTQKRSPIH